MKPTPYRGPRSSPRAKSGPPSEADIQKELAKILDQAHLLWTATANGGKRDKRTAAALKAQGIQHLHRSGVDLVRVVGFEPTLSWS